MVLANDTFLIAHGSNKIRQLTVPFSLLLGVDTETNKYFFLEGEERAWTIVQRIKQYVDKESRHPVYTQNTLGYFVSFEHALQHYFENKIRKSHTRIADDIRNNIEVIKEEMNLFVDNWRGKDDK